MARVVDRVNAAYRRLAEVDIPEIWIAIVSHEELLSQARAIELRLAAGEELPLAGLIGAVKDNIDLAGLPTTAGCPAYAYLPELSARAVARLEAGGLIIMGKTNMDQFATGLVGTRSPFGALASLSDRERVSGGSSSGSALAVAHGIVDVALGTDTAGSGRVPAAFNGLVGLKPTHGVISTVGVVPACPSLDCISVFAHDVATATRVAKVASAPDDLDPYSRSFAEVVTEPRRALPRIGVAAEVCLAGVEASRLALFEASVSRFEELGLPVRTIDVSPLLAIGDRLYDGAFVAERYAAVGEFVELHRGEVDPVVGAIIERSKELPAHQLSADLIELARARREVAAIFAEVDVLILPTTGEHPTLVEVADDPLGPNTRLGRFTNFCNLLELCAIAVPMWEERYRSRPSGETFGITLFAPAFHDDVVADIASSFLGEVKPPAHLAPSAGRVVVVGAHLTGEPLHHQLTDRAAQLATSTTTAAAYRLYALDTTPPKPGLVRVAEGGVAIEVEVFEIAYDQLGNFLTELASPLAIGPVELADGSIAPGFLLDAAGAATGARDISDFGGWRAYRASLAAG